MTFAPDWFDSIREYLDPDRFMPHGACYQWRPELVWTHAASDLLIGLAYLAISVALYALVRRIRLPFSPIILAFGAFIFACGCTHFIEVVTIWTPYYGLADYGTILGQTPQARLVRAMSLSPLACTSKFARPSIHAGPKKYRQRTTPLECHNSLVVTRLDS